MSKGQYEIEAGNFRKLVKAVWNIAVGLFENGSAYRITHTGLGVIVTGFGFAHMYVRWR
ncbi:MAG TPA: hypothetical protein PKJ20_06680 [Bacillota bacterium]|nr:hypothetical protein [Bacillota bacterium]